MDIFDAASVARRERGLNTAKWMLLPAELPPPFIEAPSNLGDLQGFVFPYPMRHPIPFDPGQIFAHNLHAHWEKVVISAATPYLRIARLADSQIDRQ